MSFSERLERVLSLRDALRQRRGAMVSHAAKSLAFTMKDSEREVDATIDRLGMFPEAATLLSARVPLRGPESRVALMLAYNGSSWLSTAITSIYLVGNSVDVKFSSKGTDIMRLTEEMYRPVFGGAISFFEGSGRSFLEYALRDPRVSAAVVFGFDENILPYEKEFRAAGKTLVFEGPGQDPFIVFPDADLSLALSDLSAAKFMYSGQTCTAPKRIFVHRAIYDEFLDRFEQGVRRLVVGDPADPRTDIGPVASDLAVRRIAAQLEDARARGAKITVGGLIEGNLVFPTVVRGAKDDFLGMREEVFGPVAFTTPFATEEEVVRRARSHKYGLRASVFGGEAATRTAAALKGEDYCHPVPGFTFGRFGTVCLNQCRAETWRGAFVTKAVGGYGYSGWIWETVGGEFRLKQGPKLLSLETSRGAGA